MSTSDRDDFDDLPILAELRAELESRFGTAGTGARARLGKGLGLLPVLLATGTAIAVAVLALAVIKPGHAHHNPSGAPVHPVKPPQQQLPPATPAQQKAIGRAQRKVVGRDPACRVTVNRGQTLSQGSPGQPLLSRLGVLRRPAPPRDASWRTLFNNGWDIGAEVDVNYIRRARTDYGKAFYLIPEGHITPFGAIPGRCYGELRAALGHEVRHESAQQRAVTLAHQQEELGIQRLQARQRAGLCFAAVSLHHRGRIGGVDMGCSPATQALGPDLNGGIGEGDRAGGSIFAAIVPDGVASVTLRFAAGNGHPARTVNCEAVNNVVVFKIPPGTYHAPFPSQIIRRDAGGQVIDTGP